jgi:hypothetical protein
LSSRSEFLLGTPTEIEMVARPDSKNGNSRAFMQRRALYESLFEMTVSDIARHGLP